LSSLLTVTTAAGEMQQAQYKMANFKKEKLILLNAENNQQYELILSHEDCQKALEGKNKKLYTYISYINFINYIRYITYISYKIQLDKIENDNSNK